MNCAKCGGPNVAGRGQCGFCGAPIEEAPTPDAIAKLVEDKARQLVEEATLRSRHERHDAAEAAAAFLARSELATFRKSLERMRENLAKANAARPGLFGLARAPAIAYSLVCAFIATMVVPGVLASFAGVPISAATMVVALVAGALFGFAMAAVTVGWWRRSEARRDRVLYAEAVERLEQKVAEGGRAMGRGAAS